jgi:segregation and condensation protein A
MPLQPIPIEQLPERAAIPVGDGAFQVKLPVFEGPLQLLLHLIESRQLDVLTVPLADLADAYLEHLTRHPIDLPQLAEFVTVAAQLVLLKSRRLLPGEPAPPAVDGEEEPDEEELRRRLLEYRTLRDAARSLGERDMTMPALRREPRESDLPEAPWMPLQATILVEALARLATLAEPEAPPPEVVKREVTIAMQIQALRTALGQNGRVVLPTVLAACASRTEAVVMLMATLELVRRRQVVVEQSRLFGPILVRVGAAPAPPGAPEAETEAGSGR